MFKLLMTTGVLMFALSGVSMFQGGDVEVGKYLVQSAIFVVIFAHVTFWDQV